MGQLRLCSSKTSVDSSAISLTFQPENPNRLQIRWRRLFKIDPIHIGQLSTPLVQDDSCYRKCGFCSVKLNKCKYFVTKLSIPSLQAPLGVRANLGVSPNLFLACRGIRPTICCGGTRLLSNIASRISTLCR